MVSRCSRPSEIFVNKTDSAAYLVCFSCGFSHELGPGADLPLLNEIEELDHHKGRWKRER